MTSHKSILFTENLEIGYQTTQKNSIQKNINLRFDSGKLIAIIGKNGKGKSTLIKTLTRLIQPLSGHIFLNDKNINEYSAAEISQLMGIVLTEKITHDQLTVQELITLGRQPYTNWLDNLSENDIEEIKKAITLTHIENLTTKKVSEISDGQLQKCLIARVLAQNTPIIFLDEPSTHLDLENKVSILKLLQKISHEQKKCIVYSTHDIDLAIQLSDEIIVLTDDVILQDEPCHLISNGVFNNLFDSPNLQFDAKKGKFIII